MLLRDLDRKNENPDVLLITTNSAMLDEFLRDKMKRHYHVGTDSIFEIESKSDLKPVREILDVSPPFADRWFVSINLDKFDFRSHATIADLVLNSKTCFFFITGTLYANYKKMKDLIDKPTISLYDYYLKSLRKSDFLYLYDAFVREEDRLTPSLFKFAFNNYNSNVDAFFTLLMRLNEGVKVTTQKDIVDICGIGGLSTESYLLSLMKPLSGSDKGLKIVLKNKIKAGKELGDVYGYEKFYRFISKNILYFCEIKMLTISGVIYRKVKDLPAGYDEQRLAHYNKYLPALSEVPLSELLRLKQTLGERVWKSDMDLIAFLYSYYGVKSQETLKILGVK